MNCVALWTNALGALEGKPPVANTTRPAVTSQYEIFLEIRFPRTLIQ